MELLHGRPRLARDAVHVLHIASLSKTHDPSPHESLKGEVRYAQVTLARRFDREDIWMAPFSVNSWESLVKTDERFA